MGISRVWGQRLVCAGGSNFLLMYAAEPPGLSEVSGYSEIRGDEETLHLQAAEAGQARLPSPFCSHWTISGSLICQLLSSLFASTLRPLPALQLAENKPSVGPERLGHGEAGGLPNWRMGPVGGSASLYTERPGHLSQRCQPQTHPHKCPHTEAFQAVIHSSHKETSR